MKLFLLANLFVILIVHSHILMPPFLPKAAANQYYEQKFRISKLDNANFKISGLPKEIFWTSNGTIFGTPTTAGQWKINIAYESLTEVGTYETILTVRHKIMLKSPQAASNNKNNRFQIVFPQNLIFKKNTRQLIDFKTNNGIQPISWKFVTLPKGVNIVQNGRLSVQIQKQGIYIVRIQALDSQQNLVQAFATLNVQNSIQNLGQFFADNTVYVPSQNVNRLLEITKKQAEVTRQLAEAAKVLGWESALLKQNQAIFNQVSNNLIQLQSQAKIIYEKLEKSLRDKNIHESKLQQAATILQNAQESLNLALIEQSSNNNLLQDSQVQKAKAQVVYDKAAKDLVSQTELINAVQKRLLQSQQHMQGLEQNLSEKRVSHDELAKQILTKQKQIASGNKDLLKIQQQALGQELQVRMQQDVLSKEKTQYSIIQNNLLLIQNKAKSIAQQVQNFRKQRQALSKQMLDIDAQVNQLKQSQIVKLQTQIRDNSISLSDLLFKFVQSLKKAGNEGHFIEETISKVKFEGCSSGQYPSVQGIFKISEGSIVDQFYKTQTGHRILFGNCTRMPSLKVGDQIIFLGYTAHGAIHADIIAPY